MGNGDETNYRLTVLAPKRRYLSYLRERWWVVLICVSVALGGVLCYETLQPETYGSFAELYASGEMELNVVNMFNEESQTYYGTQIELLKSAYLQNAAFQRINYVPKPGEKTPVKLDVVQPMKTSILVLNATGSDASLTQRFLQALVDVYLEYKKDMRRTTSDEVVLSLTEQLAAKEKDLKTEQENWTEFQRTNSVAVLDEEGKSAGVYLADLNIELAKLNVNRELLVGGLGPAIHEHQLPASDAVSSSETNSPTGETKSDDVPLSDGSGTVSLPETELKTAGVQLALLRAQRDQTLADHGQAAARRLDDEVTNMEQRVSVLKKEAADDRMERLNQLERRIAVIKASIPDWEEKVLKMNELLAESQRLKNNVQREQGFYDHLLSTLQTADLGKNVQQERLSVLQSATPGVPVSRHLVLRTLLGGMFGGVFALAIVFVWYLLDDRFVSVYDVKEQFGEAVLGLIPEIKTNRSKPKEALLQRADSRYGYVESYRHLRSALLLSSSKNKRPQVILITSAVPSEGKTTTAINIARVLADSGFRVALVDSDPHQGNVHQLLGAENQKGLLDFMRGAADLKSVLHAGDVNGFDFISIGDAGDRIDGLFLKPRFDDLLNELRTGHDFVIIDSAPILASDDTAFLASRVDVAVMVVRSFYSRSRLVRQSLDMLYQRQVKEVSIVFNRARAEDLSKRYVQNGAGRRAKIGDIVKV